MYKIIIWNELYCQILSRYALFPSLTLREDSHLIPAHCISVTITKRTGFETHSISVCLPSIYKAMLKLCFPAVI